MANGNASNDFVRVVAFLDDDARASLHGDGYRVHLTLRVARCTQDTKDFNVSFKWFAKENDPREFIAGLKKNKPLELLATLAKGNTSLNASSIRIDRVDYELEDGSLQLLPLVKTS